MLFNDKGFKKPSFTIIICGYYRQVIGECNLNNALYADETVLVENSKGKLDEAVERSKVDH